MDRKTLEREIEAIKTIDRIQAELSDLTNRNSQETPRKIALLRLVFDQVDKHGRYDQRTYSVSSSSLGEDCQADINHITLVFLHQLSSLLEERRTLAHATIKETVNG